MIVYPPMLWLMAYGGYLMASGSVGTARRSPGEAERLA
jgi:hypothetical protein